MKANLPNQFASWLTINRACNLHCTWCYANPVRFKDQKNMSMETAQSSINLFKDLPLERVILIGGEPTIHPHFLKIVRMIKGADLVPVVITNSVRFKNRDFLYRAIDTGIAGITTSLKGSSNEQYKLLTGKKVFNDVMIALKNINNSGINHNLSITVSDDLLVNFDSMINTIVESGVKSFSLDMERPIIINNKVLSASSLSPRQMVEFFVNIYPKLECCGVDFVMKISLPFCLFPKGFIDKLKENKRIVSGCHIYVGSGIIIDVSGNLLPCNHFCDNALGKLGVDFSDASEYFQFRARSDIEGFYKILSSYPHEKCQTCNHWQQCGAGCRINWLYKEAKELMSV